ncbi:sporulation histidine kinase inhibitor Sda [Alteribacillus sp. YIM 98480]|uniref:sporulation histidine kinase inhibitor Sda n=1 Tax=Alteribacillus sp. YIM 98480 TaxID=2606599 RepID=UPI00131E2FAC|nr:sporulation histidine kinase inhibitor Sda [Alteribacillus sp. YIM 98480]
MILEGISTNIVMEAYNKAILLELDYEFVVLLKEDLERRLDNEELFKLNLIDS